MQSISDWWRYFFYHTVFWDAFWPAVCGALVGASVAFSLEHQHRKRERIRHEVGECNKLIFILGQLLSFLEDAKESLFDTPAKKHGRAPTWDEIGAFVGAPDRGPEFIIGEYTFLLEDEISKDDAPDVLNDIYRAEGNFKAILARINLRNELWYDFSEQRAASQFKRGESAIPDRAHSEALGKRISELTTWLAEDLPGAIESFKKLMPKLHAVLKARYPGRTFIDFWPVADTKALPLSVPSTGE